VNTYAIWQVPQRGGESSNSIKRQVNISWVFLLWNLPITNTKWENLLSGDVYRARIKAFVMMKLTALEVVREKFLKS
jgi:hypothetical protein